MLNLQDRMRMYEGASKNYLTRRMPVIIRIDGKAFHTFTKGLEKPFDSIVTNAMIETSKFLCKNIQNCKLAYTQSDEISLLLVDYDKLETEPWFNNNVQKMVSVSASMATLAFNKAFKQGIKDTIDKLEIPDLEYVLLNDIANLYYKKCDTALFDSRVFTLPKEEVCNYFIWRQRDAIRNSKQALGQAYFSSKELHGLSQDDIVNKLIDEHDISWSDYSSHDQRGVYIIKKAVMHNSTIRTRWLEEPTTPLFEVQRGAIDKFL